MKVKSLIKKLFGEKKPLDTPNYLRNLFTKAYGNPAQGSFYSVSAEDWYKTYPYRFRIVTKSSLRDAEESVYYSLPIPPEALNYTMVSASQLIPTLGGVVEETSRTVFWQISLSGTTGIGISRFYEKDKPNNPDGLDKPVLGEKNFRTVLKGGILANTFNKVVNVADSLQNAWEEGATGAVGLIEGLASTAQRYNTSAVRSSIPEDSVWADIGLDFSRFGTPKPNATNGYVEIHLLHNFLNAYSNLKEKDPDNTKLYFESQKDNMQWQVIVKNFNFQKNANQPYLYRYSINLQGFDLAEVGGKIREAVDRFGPDGDLGDVSSFTLSGAIQRAKALDRKINKNPTSLIVSKPPVV